MTVAVVATYRGEGAFVRGAAAMPIEAMDEEQLLEQSEPTHPCNFRLPISLVARLKALADHRGVKLTLIVRMILKAGISELEKKWGVKPPPRAKP